MKLRVVLTVGVLVVLTGCSIWPQARSDSGRSGYNPFETKISLDSLAPHPLVPERFISGVAPGEPVVGSDGFTYVADGSGDVGAYDIRACQPGRCRPAFSVPGSQPTLTHGMLFTLGSGGSGVSGYDAKGAQNCSGTPVVCAPVYGALTVQFGNPSTSVLGYVASGDVLYELQEVNDEGERRFVVAYDLNGVQGCRHDPSEVVCDSMWISGFGDGGDTFNVGRLASTDGRVFVRENDDGGQALVALDGTGVLWSGPGDFTGNPVTAAGLVWVSRRTGEIDAFDASGRTGCSGTPKVCTPQWTAAPPSPASGYAVANGHLYIGTTDGHLYVFDATGGQGCIATTKICAALWSAVDDPGYAINEPTIANGIVYAVSSNGDVDLLDAAGNVGCRGMPKVCHRVFNDHLDAPPAWSPTVTSSSAPRPR